MSLAVGETHGTVSIDDGPTPKGLNLAVMKIDVPKAPWSAVAAATAFLPSPHAHLPNGPKVEGGSCCYRTPKRFAQFHRKWCATGHGRLCGRLKE